jgi:hypothetical protein
MGRAWTVIGSGKVMDINIFDILPSDVVMAHSRENAALHCRLQTLWSVAESHVSEEGETYHNEVGVAGF